MNDLKKVQSKDEEKNKVKEEAEVFRINTSVKISSEKFTDNFNLLLRVLEEDKNLSLMSVLTVAISEFNFNKWIIRIPSPIHEQILIKEKSFIMNYMRNGLNINDLYFEILVDETLNPKIELPINAQEKFQLMAEKNPNIILLKEIFKTRIID